MQSKPSLALGVALGLVFVTGCSSPAALTRAGSPAATKASATLADATKQAAGTQLSTELALQLKADRAMSDAELLLAAEGTSSYALASLNSGPGNADDRRGSGDDRRGPGGNAGPGGAPAQAGADGQASPPAPPQGDRQQAAQACRQRDQQEMARRKPQLEQRKGQFKRDGQDQTTQAGDGGKQVMSRFQVNGTQTLSVKRTFDDQGQLVQAVETLSGTADGVGFDCERSRTLKPDGTEEIASDVQLTIQGKVHHVRWAKHVGKDGKPSGTGSIVRPDGTEISLTSGGEAGAETISGADASAGVTVEVKAGDDSAAATLDGGAAGTSTVDLGL
jgi:hypothetical protein